MKTYERNVEAIKNGNTSKRFFQFQKDGTYVIRVMPPYSQEGVWYKAFREYVIEVGGQWKFLTSPFGLSKDPDPLFNYRKSLVTEDNRDNDALVKTLTSKSKFLMNVVVLSSPDNKTIKDGIQVAKFPKKVKDSLMEFDLDSEYGDITNLETGFNIIVKKSGSGIQTSYQVMPQRTRSNLAELATQSGVDISTWDLNDLDIALTPSSTEELQSVLDYLLESPISSTPKNVSRDFNAFKSAQQTGASQNENVSVHSPVTSPVQSVPEVLNMVPPPNIIEV